MHVLDLSIVARADLGNESHDRVALRVAGKNPRHLADHEDSLGTKRVRQVHKDLLSGEDGTTLHGVEGDIAIDQRHQSVLEQRRHAVGGHVDQLAVHTAGRGRWLQRDHGHSFGQQGICDHAIEALRAGPGLGIS
jgi:hypothetical protein